MGKRVNRYRLTSLGLKIERSIPLADCEGKSDLEIAEYILKAINFNRVLLSVKNNDRSFSVTKIR